MHDVIRRCRFYEPGISGFSRLAFITPDRCTGTKDREVVSCGGCVEKCSLPERPVHPLLDAEYATTSPVVKWVSTLVAAPPFQKTTAGELLSITEDVLFVDSDNEVHLGHWGASTHLWTDGHRIYSKSEVRWWARIPKPPTSDSNSDD